MACIIISIILGEDDPKTLEDIGKHFCVTRERIRQVNNVMKVNRESCVRMNCTFQKRN